MRGRTNITQRSGTVPVNGDIIEAEVMSEKIDIGDFVRYGTISSEKVLHDSSSKIYKNDKISNNNYLILQTDKELKLDRKNISQIKTVYNW